MAFATTRAKNIIGKSASSLLQHLQTADTPVLDDSMIEGLYRRGARRAVHRKRAAAHCGMSWGSPWIIHDLLIWFIMMISNYSRL